MWSRKIYMYLIIRSIRLVKIALDRDFQNGGKGPVLTRLSDFKAIWV